MARRSETTACRRSGSSRLKQSEFAERREDGAGWNAAHPRVKRGLAITPVKFGISFTLTHYNQAGALVHLYQDGTVQVNHGGTEMGQGLHTKILGVAMRELGLPRGTYPTDANQHGQGAEHVGHGGFERR